MRDLRDWRVVDGWLEATPIRFDASDRFHALGARLAERLVRELAAIDCILLVGSAAIHAEGYAPNDLDITALVSHEVTPELGERLTAAIQPLTELRVDLLVAPAALLAAKPELSLATAFRSVVLHGAPPWPMPLRVPAATIASAQWKDRRHELRVHLAHLRRALDGDSAPTAELVERVQKRALRLIAPVALARLATYSIELRRCAELVGELLPGAAAVANAVVADVEARAHDMAAIDRAVDLAIAVLACRVDDG